MITARIREILEKEYGVRSTEELDEAVRELTGVNIGVFTLPEAGKELEDECGEEVC